MKLSQLITYCLLLLGTYSWGQYSEDLSKVRPEIEFDEEQFVKEALTTEVVPFENHNNALVEEKTEEYVEWLDEIKCARGYRIQVYSGHSEEKVGEIKELLKSLEGFEKVDVYVEFNGSFRVKVGNYINRLEAHAALQKLIEEFDNALLLPENCIPVEKIK